MRVLFVVPYPLKTTPCQRFRFEQYLDILERVGIQCIVDSFISRALYRIIYRKGMYLQKTFYTFLCFLKRGFTILRSFRYDVVFIHREACPFGIVFFEYFFKLIGKKIIYDFDDAIYLPNVSSANKIAGFFKNQNKTKKIIALSDIVIAGNTYLKSYVSQFNRNATVIPTTIDSDEYLLVEKKTLNPRPIYIGWSGSYTTTQHLILLKEILEGILKRFKLQIKIIGAPLDFSMGDIPMVVKEWRLDNEIEELSTFDIGVMPLPDDEWGRGKCGLKALQYMALGIPAVCSPVGVNKEIIEDGVNGFLASKEKEWIDKLSFLIESKDLRSKIGEAGRRTVEERYSVKVCKDRYIDLFRNIK